MADSLAHTKCMNELKQREIRRELEQIRLIKEAGFDGSSLLTGVGITVGSRLAALTRKQHCHHTAKRHLHKSLHGKSVR